ncbi:septum formation family protein [Aquihabitans daechungensis]|uniref:septum formation family protein n=1 Tax=Aquihabitans daechungensis TaxID=1052257 RepID=UPI003BA389E1
MPRGPGRSCSGADVVVLRAELATADAIDLTPTDAPVGPLEPPVVEPEVTVIPEETQQEPPTVEEAPVDDAPVDEAPVEEAPVAAPATEPAPDVEPEPEAEAEPAPPASALPPTAVGSMPELIDEITPEPDREAPAAPNGGFAMAGTHGGGVDPNATRRVPPRAVPTKRRLEKGVRNSVIALVIAIACFVASNFTDLAAVVALLWFLTAVALIVAVLDGFRGRRRAQTHPERVHGVWLGSISLVLAIGGLVGLTAAGLAAVGDEPAADAPAGLGDLQSVQVARWGYQRATRLSDNGWKQPAREVGTCWTADPRRARDEQRVEIPDTSDRTKCTTAHTLQVAKVFAVNRDADAPYPGTAELLTTGQAECRSIAKRVAAKDVEFAMKVEYPTEVGWSDGDHDVACVLVTPTRTAPIGI